jgi:hypothetical protein
MKVHPVVIIITLVFCVGMVLLFVLSSPKDSKIVFTLVTYDLDYGWLITTDSLWLPVSELEDAPIEKRSWFWRITTKRGQYNVKENPFTLLQGGMR